MCRPVEALSRCNQGVYNVSYLPALGEETLIRLQNLAHVCNSDLVCGKICLHRHSSYQRLYRVIFIDADWDSQHLYFDWAVKLSRKGSCIYVDNAVRQIWENEREGNRELGRNLLEAVKKDDRVSATLIPTLQTHKTDLREVVDGYVMAIVK